MNGNNEREERMEIMREREREREMKTSCPKKLELALDFYSLFTLN